MEQLLYDKLIAAGWSPGRKISKEKIIEKFQENGFESLEKVVCFLEEYGDLQIEFNKKIVKNKTTILSFNFSRAMEIEVVERVWDYEERVQKKMCLIGTLYEEYMVVLMAEDGGVYIALDDDLSFVASDGVAAMEAIITHKEVVPIS